jgi:hypothetical protein
MEETWDTTTWSQDWPLQRSERKTTPQINMQKKELRNSSEKERTESSSSGKKESAHWPDSSRAAWSIDWSGKMGHLMLGSDLKDHVPTKSNNMCFRLMAI